MKPRHDPGQGSLFGSDPEAPAPVSVPPEKVAAELPGQLFLPLANAAPTDVLGECRAYLDEAPQGWTRGWYFGAPSWTRYTGGKLCAIVYQDRGAFHFRIQEPYREGELLHESGADYATHYDAQRAAIAVLERA